MPALYSPVSFNPVDENSSIYLHLHQQANGSSCGTSIGRPYASGERDWITPADRVYASTRIQHLRQNGFLSPQPVWIELWEVGSLDLLDCEKIS